jgi:hypothetical protein
MSSSIDFHFKVEEEEKIKTRKSSDVGGKPIFIISKEKKNNLTVIPESLYHD